MPQYDVRLTRELANRRFAMSIVRQGLRLVTLHALDASAIVVAVLVANGVLGSPLGASVWQLTPSLIAFILVGLNVRGSYQPGDARRDIQRLVTGTLIGVFLATLPLVIQSATTDWKEFLGVFGVAAMVLLAFERRAVNAILHAAYVHGIWLRRALLISTGDEYIQVVSGIAPHQVGRPAEDQILVGYLTPEISNDPTALGSFLDLEDALLKHDVSELIVASQLEADALAAVAEACFERGVRVLVIAPIPARRAMSRTMWAELTMVGRLPAYQLHPMRLELPALIVKRVTDVLVSSIGLVISAPLMLIIALAIKIESRGPVFFRQRRVGLGGRQFQMWKFRSMSREAESLLPDMAHLNPYTDGRLFKLQADPRITRVGRLLRRFSLDELPQLLNILAGDMSVVGPRPPLPSEVEGYEPRHYIRLSVVPGLTGPWQVNGRNLITNFEDVVRLERDYIERWSLKSDIKIMLRTFFVVLSGEGAY